MAWPWLRESPRLEECLRGSGVYGKKQVIEQQSKLPEPSAIGLSLPAIGGQDRLPWSSAVPIMLGVSAALWVVLAVMASMLGVL
jgi:hypothetical protein